MFGYRYKNGRRRLRRGSLVFLLVFSALFLVSCVTGSNAVWIKGFFGWDLTDYRTEPVERVLPIDSEVCAELCDTVEMLTVDSLTLKPFSKTSDAVGYYRDEILNNLLCEGYSLYTGNAASIGDVAAFYPNLTVSTLIPAKDLENAVSRYFGAQSVSHGDGELFAYLKRAGYYTFSMKAWEKQIEVLPEKIEETYHTYRFLFRLTDGGNTSELYEATMVKRDDGSAYLRALELAK